MKRAIKEINLTKRNIELEMILPARVKVEITSLTIMDLTFQNGVEDILRKYFSELANGHATYSEGVYAVAEIQNGCYSSNGRFENIISIPEN